jgi:hypothetical protein
VTKKFVGVFVRFVRRLLDYFFCKTGNFFNSEIIGKKQILPSEFIRDQFSPRDAVNATQISNPKAPSYCKQSTICQFTGTSSGQTSCSVV